MPYFKLYKNELIKSLPNGIHGGMRDWKTKVEMCHTEFLFYFASPRSIEKMTLVGERYIITNGVDKIPDIEEKRDIST